MFCITKEIHCYFCCVFIIFWINHNLSICVNINHIYSYSLREVYEKNFLFTSLVFLKNDILNSFYNDQSRFIFSRDKSFHVGKFGGKTILLHIPDRKLIIDESWFFYVKYLLFVFYLSCVKCSWWTMIQGRWTTIHIGC